MALNIEDVEGIGPAYAQKLVAAGVHTDAEMLDKAGSAKGRAELSALTGIAGSLILRWANHVDLMRVSGIGPPPAYVNTYCAISCSSRSSVRRPVSSV